MKSSSLLPIIFAMIAFLPKVFNQTNPYYPDVKHEEWFKAVPSIDDETPEWAKVMYLESENFEKISKLFSDYYSTNEIVKNMHVRNFKYYCKHVKNYVEDNGYVVFPGESQEFAEAEKKKKENSQRNSITNTWTNLGPSFTYNGGNPDPLVRQANIYCIAVAPSNTSIVYAGAETGGVFKSIDKGLSWEPISYAYAIGNMQDIKVDPLNPDIVYLASGKNIYKTIDGGTNWNLEFTHTGSLHQLYIHSIDTDLLYAASTDGLYESSDGGLSWTSIYAGYVYDIETKPDDETTLYISIKNDATVRPEIIKSVDSGASWTLMDNGYYSPSVLSESTVYGCKIGVTPSDPERVYAGIIANGKDGDNGWIGIYYSLDAGATWQEDSGFDGGPYVSGNDKNTNWYVAGYSSGYHQGWYNFDIDVSHADPDKLWIGTIWFCESENKGGNIEYIRGTRNLSMHADIQDIDVVGDDIWIASDGGINYSNDECQTVETRMAGITAAEYWGFGIGWNEDVWTGGRYHNGNASYHQNYGAAKVIALGGSEAPTGYVNPIDNRINYFSDSGAKKIPLSLDDASEGAQNLSLYPNQSYWNFSSSEVEWHPYKSNTVYLGKDNDFFKSTDGGVNFQSTYTFPGATRRFEISRDDPNYIYVLVRVSSSDWRTFKSIDGGTNFIELPEPTLTGGSWNNLSLSLNPFDKNEVWLASNSSSNGNKIFSSTDGGNTWTNHYEIELEDQGIRDLIYQASPNGDKIYTMTNDNFFYYDKNSGVWTQSNDGLPIQHKGTKMLPFYRDNKIRMASDKGIWEVAFQDESSVQAIPMVNKDSLFCNKDTVQFESLSIIDPQGATWAWSFNPIPSYIDDASKRNPKVVFGTDGDIEVTLTITDINGNTDSRTVPNMVNISHQCEPDLIAGSALHTFENGDRLVIPNANLENITNFTITGWWKPEGNQQAYSALVSSGDWCAHCDDTEGLIFDYFGSKLWYKWPGMADNWGSNSGIEIPIDEWSYVALTIEPTKATLYLNDQKYVHTKNLQPGNISNLYLAYGHYSKSFKGLIDEVTLWTRTLDENEIYKLRHNTKEEIIPTDPDLIAYYQNNTLINGTNVLDHAGTYHGVLEGAAQLSESTVPVGTGKAQLVNIVPGTHQYDFNELESELTLNDCLQSEGKMVMTRIELEPDVNPNDNESPSNYWVLNYYSAENEIGQIDELKLKVIDADYLTGLVQSSDAILHTRSENGEGSTWNAKSSAFQLNEDQLSFDRKIQVNESSQIGLSNLHDNLMEDDPGNPCQVDTIPGNTLSLPGGNGDYSSTPNLDLNTNSFTASAWVKPNGLQNDWAGIIFCRGNGTTAGLSCANNNELRYHWDGGGYNWSSGAYLPVDVWSHVALVVSPTEVVIYLNGEAYTRITNHVIQPFTHPIRIGSDQTSSSRYFNGEIDEVCIWDRSLDINEVRLLRHLTKDDIIPTDNHLKLYYQFNEEEGMVYDRSGNNNHGSIHGNSLRVISTAPVGGGESQQINVSAAGNYETTVGMNLEFGAGSFPDGELVISRLNINPDTLANTNEHSFSYWIINNYGNNQTFSSLELINFNELEEFITLTLPENIKLHQRTDNAFGPNWEYKSTGTEIDATTESISFSTNIEIDQFGQFILERFSGLQWIGVQDNDWDNPNNWAGGIVPTSIHHVTIPVGVPFYPIVNINNVKIQTLCIEAGASILIPEQFHFDVLIGN